MDGENRIRDLVRQRFMKTKIRILIVITVLSFALAGALAQKGGGPSGGREASDEQATQSTVLSAVGQSIGALWPEKSCASYVTRHSGYPLVSVACRLGYSKKNRRQFLDAIFKRGFILKNENWDLKPSYAFYLYKTEYPIASGRYVFFKLYFRNATYLWPKTPFIEGRVAIFVQDLYRMKDLVRWQTLGVPLSYGVVTHKRETAKISETVRNYRQELWMSLSLEPRRMSPLIGKVLTLKAGLDKEKRTAYLDEAFSQVGPMRGVSNRMGSLFTSNVFAMRTLFKDLKTRKVTHYLDTMTAKHSVGFETAQVMSMKAFKRDYILDHVNTQEALLDNWRRVLQRLKETGYAVVVVHAGNWKAFEFIKSQVKIRRARQIHFVMVSALPRRQR